VESTSINRLDSWQDHEKRLDHIRAELHSLEVEAGIAESAEKAREGPLLPFFMPGTAAPEEEVDELYHYIRREIRDFYFSVSDSDLRIKLIAKQSQIEEIVCAAALGMCDRTSKSLSHPRSRGE